MKNLPGENGNKAVEIANALAGKEAMKDSRAILIAIRKADACINN